MVNPFYKDPTALTTDAVTAATSQLRRDIESAQKVIEARLDAMDQAILLHKDSNQHITDEVTGRLERQLAHSAEITRVELTSVQDTIEIRLNGMDVATKLLAEQLATRNPAEREFILGQIALVNSETARVKDVTLEKFAAIDGTFTANALALAAALAAQKEAANETNKSNTLAINKSELATKETIVADQAQAAVVSASQAAILDDLKSRVVRIETNGLASRESIDANRNVHTDNRASFTLVLGFIGTMVAIIVAAFVIYGALHA